MWINGVDASVACCVDPKNFDIMVEAVRYNLNS